MDKKEEYKKIADNLEKAKKFCKENSCAVCQIIGRCNVKYYENQLIKLKEEGK